ncbi:hypothetical protein MRB53_003045 [Persea americana]|uniref:Uncharacterized protein n=1 Tax=Persea americana TaxID=3435 RepID=A0ACC2MW33_PERAE|nr:hypothetical protein MRB53_003045 [Persea americana]|eukprot:TRINITY_DN1753_c0_g1_i1.p1 TRINITY_DN1753_c0_g1~~TRINITY_DN1753_c0_g1_i1.p1  ORF type:complete len:335 (-),score=69.16 TRINITY_DN1753_c0_g1_i1:498-1412(-)
MEKRTCKLCNRTFSNGRALGGHMRSHMTLLSPSQKPQQPQNESPSSSSSSSASSSSEEDENHKPPNYGLRENPQKSFRFADPEFSFALDASSVVQDRESETESPHRSRRSKRHRVSPVPNPKPDTEPEPLSSVSDATTEEDVALCLMMLSRDIWMGDGRAEDESQDSKEEEEEEEYDESKLKTCTKGRSRFQCETCKKVFRSYQALGGHRASHKKIRGCSTDGVRAQVGDSDVGAGEERRKIHQCPICFRVFSSGQALGGHRRSHLSAAPPAALPKFADNSIDLNLPAPVEDDDMSAVSDAGAK